MSRTLIALLVGVSLGAAGAWWLAASHSSRPAIDEPLMVRDIVDVPQARAADVERHRSDRYSRVSTIEDTLALPGDFTQTEALYVLAGRSNSAVVQDLIHDANRIADPTDRNAALSILFLRLAELDPLSALTLARMPGFSKNRGLESTIWRTWSKLDLDAALAHARGMANPADRNLAAQSMLAAYGYLGNATTQRIEAELGVRADGNARARYLYNIADRAPAEAVRWIQSLPPMQQPESVRLLAGYLARRDAADMLAYAGLFQAPQHRKIFEDVIRAAYAQEQPERFLANLPPGVMRGPLSGEYLVALRVLAARDVDRALDYYDGLTSPNDRALLGSVIAGELATRDPERAIQWALEQDTSNATVVVGVLSQLAAVDPTRALFAIDQLDNAQVKRQVLGSVVGSAAQSDALAARAFVDNIANPRDREIATHALFNTWVMVDAAAALDNLLSTKVKNADSLIAQAGFNLAMNDLDAAIRTLPRIGGQVAGQWRAAIVQQLVQQRGAAAGQRFVEQQRGQPGYAEMQAAAINGLVDQDIHAARHMVESMPAGSARDQSYATVVSRHAYNDPQEAAGWLASIEDEQLRAMATQQVASAWQQTDPQGAMHWVLNLPAGPARDDAILGLSANLVDRGQAVTGGVIEQIDDPQKRKQAYILQVWNAARTDQERALALLSKIDLTDEERRQIEAEISRRSDAYYHGLGIQQ